MYKIAIFGCENRTENTVTFTADYENVNITDTYIEKTSYYSDLSIVRKSAHRVSRVCAGELQARDE